jgi:hypothetical protein
MSLCPLSLTSYINGIYYYYCFDCKTNLPTGAQDTRLHMIGVNCDAILDPMRRKAAPPLTVASPQPLPVINSIAPSMKWRNKGIVFDNNKINILKAPGVKLDHRDDHSFRSSFTLSSGPTRYARLFKIHFYWGDPTATTPTPLEYILRVGQELVDNSETPDLDYAADSVTSPVANLVTISYTKRTSVGSDGNRPRVGEKDLRSAVAGEASCL